MNPPQLGGKYAPAKTLNGSNLKILVIFAQFKDDNKDISDINWPKNQMPVWANTFMGTDASQVPFAQGTLSNYFYEMSNGQNIVIGHIHPNLVIVDAPVTTSYGTANQKVLQQIDEVINFNAFDKWDMNGSYNQIYNQQDGYVDAVYIIWRNLDTNYTWGGMGQLGGIYTSGENVIIDNRVPTISMTINIGKKSNYSYNDNLTGLMAHEYGHYLFEGGHNFEPYFAGGGNRQRGIGLMPGSYGTVAMNPYEKYLLGYASYTDIFYNQTGTLPDYQTTGMCYRIPIPMKNADGTNNNDPSEYYIVANHQKTTYYEKTKGNGLYIYHVKNKTYDTNNMDVVCADGLWHWKIDKWVDRPVGIGSPTDFYNYNPKSTPLPDKLPYIVHDYVDRVNGRDELQEIIYAPYSVGDGRNYWFDNWVDASGNTDESPIGDQEDAFNVGHNQVFSPWSNPPAYNKLRKSTNSTVQIINNNNGNFNLQFYVDSLSSLSAPPSKPQNVKVGWSSDNYAELTWESNIEPDIQNYKIYKEVAGSGMYITVAHDPNKTVQSWKDTKISKPSLRDNKLTCKYKVIALDNTNKQSVVSEEVSIIGHTNELWKNNSNNNDDEISSTINEYKLFTNYPNPFNPTTKISFNVKEQGNVRLLVFNSLGEQVNELLNQFMDTGSYSVQFNASNLPSGIYFYSFEVNGFREVKKMMLVK